MWGVCWGNCLPLRVSPISAVTKRIAETFFFWRNSRERKQPSWKQLPKWFFHPCHPLCHLPPFLISFLLLLLLTNLSLHTALHTNVSFLEPSEAGCLIEVSQVYGQSWGEATVNSSLCYQPRGSHNDTDMHTQASTLPHAHKCTHAHTHTREFINPKQKSALDWSHFPRGLQQKEKLCLMDIIVKVLYEICQKATRPVNRAGWSLQEADTLFK